MKINKLKLRTIIANAILLLGMIITIYCMSPLAIENTDTAAPEYESNDSGETYGSEDDIPSLDEESEVNDAEISDDTSGMR